MNVKMEIKSEPSSEEEVVDEDLMSIYSRADTRTFPQFSRIN